MKFFIDKEVNVNTTQQFNVNNFSKKGEITKTKSVNYRIVLISLVDQFVLYRAVGRDRITWVDVLCNETIISNTTLILGTSNHLVIK